MNTVSNVEVQVSNVTVTYGDAVAVDDVTFEVNKGACLAILGANGAGKSSLARAIVGLTKPAQGRIVACGQDLRKKSPHDIARAGIVYIPEGRGIFPSLTVGENIELATGAVGHWERKSRRQEAFDYFPPLNKRQSQIARTLSGGEQQMLAVARALIVRPRVLICDELSLGLGPIIIARIYEALAMARQAGGTMILIEQQVHRALAFADTAMLMSRGRVRWMGSSDEAGAAAVHNYLGATLEREGANGQA